MTEYTLSTGQLWSMIFLIILLCGIIIFFMLRRPFSKLSPQAKWSMVAPKVKLVVPQQDARYLEELDSNIKKMTFEERCLVLQMLFEKDVKFWCGLNKDGEFWIEGVVPYNYSENIGAFVGGGED